MLEKLKKKQKTLKLPILMIYFYRGVRFLNGCPRHDMKQSDGEGPIILGLWGIQSTPWLSSLPGPLLPRVVAPDRVLSECKQIPYAKLNCLK